LSGEGAFVKMRGLVVFALAISLCVGKAKIQTTIEGRAWIKY
jgi:hypothetical protein